MLAIVASLLARSHGLSSIRLSFSYGVQSILTLLAGLLILFRPKWLHFIVAAYLIVIGAMGLVHLRW